MGLNSLYRVDISYVDEHNQLNLLLVAGAGWSSNREAMQFIQLIFKLQGIIEYARGITDKKVIIGLVNAQQPPFSVLEYVQARDIIATVGIGTKNTTDVIGKNARFPNLSSGEPDVNALQKANAAHCAQWHKLPYPSTLEDMVLLDERLEERREQEGLLNDEESLEIQDGDLQVLAAAYAGEFLIKILGGEWVFAPDDPTMDIVHLRVGKGGKLGVNMVTKVRKYLQMGSSDSIAGMVRSLIAMDNNRS